MQLYNGRVGVQSQVVCLQNRCPWPWDCVSWCCDLFLSVFSYWSGLDHFLLWHATWLLLGLPFLELEHDFPEWCFLYLPASLLCKQSLERLGVSFFHRPRNYRNQNHSSLLTTWPSKGLQSYDHLGSSFPSIMALRVNNSIEIWFLGKKENNAEGKKWKSAVHFCWSFLKGNTKIESCSTEKLSKEKRTTDSCIELGKTWRSAPVLGRIRGKGDVLSSVLSQILYLWYRNKEGTERWEQEKNLNFQKNCEVQCIKS